MKGNKNLKVTYHETQEGNNRTLNIKISTLNKDHQDILKKFTNENENQKTDCEVHLKLEDLVK